MVYNLMFETLVFTHIWLVVWGIKSMRSFLHPFLQELWRYPLLRPSEITVQEQLSGQKLAMVNIKQINFYVICIKSIKLYLKKIISCISITQEKSSRK